MKVAVIVLAALLVVAGALYFRCERARRDAAQVTSNQVAAAVAELAAVRMEWQARALDLQQAVGSVEEEKTQVVQKLNVLQARLDTVERDLQEERNQIVPVENERGKVVQQLSAVSNQLLAVRQQLAQEKRTNTLTEAEVTALQAKNTALELERVSLERHLDDLDALRAQISWIKHRVWAEKIATWKRQDLEATTGGSGGLLLKEGQWQIVLRTNRPASRP